MPPTSLLEKPIDIITLPFSPPLLPPLTPPWANQPNTQHPPRANTVSLSTPLHHSFLTVSLPAILSLSQTLNITLRSSLQLPAIDDLTVFPDINVPTDLELLSPLHYSSPTTPPSTSPPDSGFFQTYLGNAYQPQTLLLSSPTHEDITPTHRFSRSFLQPVTSPPPPKLHLPKSLTVTSMQPRKKGRPSALHRKNRGRQNHISQIRRQLQHQLEIDRQHGNAQHHQPPGFHLQTIQQTPSNPIWPHEQTVQVSTPISSGEGQRINDNANTFWSSKHAKLSDHAVVSSTSQLHTTYNHDSQLATSPEHVRHLHELQRNLSPTTVPVLPDSAAIKPDVQQEIDRQTQQPREFIQHTTQALPETVANHSQQQHQRTGSLSQGLSVAEQRHLLHLQQHLSNQGVTTGGPSNQASPQHHFAGDHCPKSPLVVQSIVNSGWPEPRNLALRQALAEPLHSSEPLLSSQQQVQARVQTDIYRAYSDESVEDEDKYVREASAIADHAKLAHRIKLKEAQRSKEMAAEAKGDPLSAKDKERERSRRESAVTRKRSEIYIQELERTARKVPVLEKTVKNLLAEFERLGVVPPHVREDSLTQLPVASAMSAVPSSEEVKAEPELFSSPNTEKTTQMFGGLKGLKL